MWKNTTDIASLTDTVNDIREKYAKSKEAEDKMKRQVQENAATAVFSEMRDRDNRRNNIVVHGLPEPDAKIKEKNSRIAKDMKKIQDLFSKLEVEVVADEAVKYARRLGEQPVGKTDPRPLLIGFKTLDSKLTVLDNSRKLAEDDNWKDVFVISDLTKRQREEESRMRQEADRLNGERSEEDAKKWLWKVVGRREKR